MRSTLYLSEEAGSACMPLRSRCQHYEQIYDTTTWQPMPWQELNGSDFVKVNDNIQMLPVVSYVNLPESLIIDLNMSTFCIDSQSATIGNHAMNPNLRILWCWGKGTEDRFCPIPREGWSCVTLSISSQHWRHLLLSKNESKWTPLL